MTPTSPMLGITSADSRLGKLMRAIAKVEGFYAVGARPNVPQRCNNPGNLIFVGQRGAVPYAVKGADGKTRTYCSWPTIEQGWNGLRFQCLLDAGRGMTLLKFINKFAPAEDGNDPKSYTASVAKDLGCTAGTLLSVAIKEPVA